MALGVAVVMIPLAALAGSASAATTASSPGPNTPESVASGINVASLPGAAVFGTTPADTPETVSFILREQNLNSLKVQVQLGIRNYLSVSQFASLYGQTEANISALTSYLAHFGIKTDVYADNVDISTTGTAGEYEQALSVTQKQYDVPAQAGSGGFSGIPAQNNVHGNVQAPLLPYRLSHFVLAILGLSNYGPYASQAANVLTSLLKPTSSCSNYCLARLACPTGVTCRRTSPPTTVSRACTSTGRRGRPDRGHRYAGRAGPGRGGVLLEQHRARQPHRQPYRGEYRRRTGRAERRLRHPTKPTWTWSSLVPWLPPRT